MPTLSISNALFTTTQQRVLGLIYSKADQSFYTNEIARLAKVGKGSLTRELERLHSAGIIKMIRRGNQTHYQANADCPIYTELLGIVRKTFGIADNLRLALAPFANHLEWAFIYGSIAKGSEQTNSDVDLMLIGESLNYSDIMENLMPLEEQLGRTINPTLYTSADWCTRQRDGNSFVQRVVQQEKIDVIGKNPGESKDGKSR